ncbi:MAG: right-handed parallel beta-helix repeat-containing protein [Calditrichaeota bacterium]|nr:right-handed parallel beta-helix repeat-containing protein [Calditrichota bacterium]
MRKQSLTMTVILLTVFTVNFALQAETHVSGPVYGSWTVNGSPYIADAALVIGERDTLIIDPGVTVSFHGRYDFQVRGVLIAEGAERDSIFFTSGNAQPNAWVGLKLLSGRAGNSRLKYCSINYTYRSIEFDIASPTVTNCSFLNSADIGLRFVNSRAELENCLISGTGRSGLTVLENSNTVFTNCTISACGDHGVSVGNGSSADVINCIISHVSDQGIYLSSSAACNLTGNYIANGNSRGIYVNSSNNVEIRQNIIESNDGTGIYLNRSDSFDLISNDIISNGGAGVQVYLGSGEISNNIIINNAQYGITIQDVAPTERYNCVWENEDDNYNGINPSDSDISENPMLDENFVPRWDGWPDNDSLRSPCIDAGDQNLLDPDGSRLEIGALFFNQNLPPVIITTAPDPFDERHGAQEIEFTVYAEDPNDHALTYTWYVNDVAVGNGNIIVIPFVSNGDYIVKIIVDDGFYMGQSSYQWEFNVDNTAVKDIENILPKGFFLSDIRPNPFNSTARFDIDAVSLNTSRIAIYDLNGRFVRDVWQGAIPAGRSGFNLEARDLSTGNYFLIVKVGSQRLQKQFTVIK